MIKLQFFSFLHINNNSIKYNIENKHKKITIFWRKINLELNRMIN